MVDKNMINYPVETVVSIDNKVISSDVVDFQEKSAGYKSVIVPAILKKLESISPLSDYVFGKIDWQGSFVLDSRIKSKIIYDSYDSAGNLTMYHKTNGIYITTLWGYNKTYLIAQIENATNLQIASALGVSNLDSINESNLASVNALRTSQPNTMIKTYTYLPLIGVSTITDPRGNTTTYTYDAFGRLEFVKDAQGNLLSENQYKYKNQ
ncbi:RHS Repeat protein [compost metagenome]